MKEFEGIDHIATRTAEEFLDALSPRNERWGPSQHHWVYRGQANADWSLVPTIHRLDRKACDDFKLTARSAPDAPPMDWVDRVDFMKRLLDRFALDLNLAGLPIPAENPCAPPRNTVISSAHPDPHMWPLMALAQHHKLPTFFLDWTRRAVIAAYFAASSALDPAQPDPPSHIAVWAAKRWRYPGSDPLGESDNFVEFYTPPAATNPNLHAQAGLFTIYVSPGSPALEQHLAAIGRKTGKPSVRRVTVPRCEAKKVLRLLSPEGISGASVFPGTDGVVLAMRERRFWDWSDDI